MKDQIKLGLIGKNIPYTFSKKYFEHKFQKLLLSQYSYEIHELESIENVSEIFKIPDLKGLNVTIPYKEKIIPYLDRLSEEAQEIGAVNCIKIENGQKIGYNTDADGFEKTFLLHRKAHHQSALVLGNGGAAKAIQYVLKKHQIPFITISRNTEINYDNLSKEIVEEHLLIIQCTPVGTYPNIDESVPFPFEGLSENHLIIDLVYNPEYSLFIKKGAQKGAKTVNGYYMLEQQAEKAWEIWTA